MNNVYKVRIQNFSSDTILNHHLFKKLKLVGRDGFDHLTYILTCSMLGLLANLSQNLIKLFHTFVVTAASWK